MTGDTLLHAKKYLSKSDQIDLIDKYWRASNYITVLQMYLKQNFFLKEKLQAEHLKEVVPGHWGTSPGINFIYAHLNAFICRYDVDVNLVVGPGHAACALLSNLFLERSLQEYYPELTVDEPGVGRLTYLFGHSQGFRTEVSPHLPGVIVDGGELGYALSVAYGSVLDRPEVITVCIVGDGEAETGPTAAAWQSNKYLDPEKSGVVLPILHLNGYRMGGRSILSTLTNEELISYFTGLGYLPLLVTGNHFEIYAALETAYMQINGIKKKSLPDVRWPMLILKTPKGWTGPFSEGRASSHKNPVPAPCSSVELLENWLKSYNPVELFDDNGSLSQAIRSIIPAGNKRIGQSLTRIKDSVKELIFPSVKKHAISPIEKKYMKNIEIIVPYLSEVFNLNEKNENFRIMSPDELVSNGLGGILLHTKKAYNRIGLEEIDTALNGRIMEILSEHVCHGWLQGYLQTGRRGILPTYEAFAPIFGSMMTQYAKFLSQSQNVSWRESVPSINYLLTSVCWANTYSHQNPEFINMAVGKNFSFVRCYFPSDANTLLACVDACLKSDNRINVIISSKREMPQWTTIEQAQAQVSKGIGEWSHFSDAHPDIIFAAAGDYPTRECIESIALLKLMVPEIKVRFVSVIDITVLGSPKIFGHALAQEHFETIFPSRLPVIFNFHGYPSAMKALLFERLHVTNFRILGYQDEGDSSAPDFYKMIRNGVSRYQIAILSLDMLVKYGKLKDVDVKSLKEQLRNEVSAYCLEINGG